MRELKFLKVFTIGLLALTVMIGCGKKKNNNDNNQPPPPPVNGQPNRDNRVGHPGYPEYDINSRPVLIRIHNFSNGDTRTECLNYQNQDVPCGDVFRLAGIQPNQYLPFQEIYLDQMGYGQQYQNQYSGWQQYDNRYGYPTYPGGTIYPQQNGLRFQANVQGYYGN
ncbi:hypothetical protein GW915_04945 [bacterium]|nr:hypothetical protein [bacterium]